jgi:hypothetical protein
MYSHAMYVKSIYACAFLCIMYSSIPHPAMHVACLPYICLCGVRLPRMHTLIQHIKQCECFVYIPHACMCMMLACTLPIMNRVAHITCTVLPCGTHASASRAWYIVMHTMCCYVRHGKRVHYNECTMFTFTHACIHMHLPFACTLMY